MKKNIIFFDIDGTLLSETTHTIPESAINALKLAQKNNNLLFINTGRCISNIDPAITALNFDGYICGCGTYVEYKGNELLAKSFSNAFTQKLITDLRECTLDAILEGKSGTYFDDNIIASEPRKIKERNLSHNLCEVKSFNDPHIDCDKLVIWINEKSNFEKFHEIYNDVFEFIRRDSDFYELVPLGYSKASGIEWITNHLNIDSDHTYAIGDSTNDLAMLKYVKNSIAMGNSTKSILDHVSYITTDIEDDGIYNALKHYELI